MKLLLDTQLLLWIALEPEKVSQAGRALVDDTVHEPVFSAASLWEVAIKNALKRPDFRVEAGVLRRGLLDNGYSELPVTGQQAAAIDTLPPLHKDPFDRLLLAQAIVEGMVLVTTDAALARYPGPVRKV